MKKVSSSFQITEIPRSLYKSYEKPASSITMQIFHQQTINKPSIRWARNHIRIRIQVRHHQYV